jgi:hypothetical protein
MLLECMAITLVFALTCGVVLMFMKFFGYAPTAPKPPMRPQRPQGHP